MKSEHSSLPLSLPPWHLPENLQANPFAFLKSCAAGTIPKKKSVARLSQLLAVALHVRGMDEVRSSGLARERRLIEMMVVGDEGGTSRPGSSLGVPHCHPCHQLPVPPVCPRQAAQISLPVTCLPAKLCLIPASTKLPAVTAPGASGASQIGG